jgi:dihydropyrimidinase
MMSSQKSDIAIVNGKVVDSQSITAADVLINDGRITAIAPPGIQHNAEQIIDAAGNYVLPGIIDAHLHPVYADRIDTLSRAAVCEGVTTLIPYIGAVKAWGQSGGLIEAIENFIAEGESTSLVDFSLHCTLMQEDLANIEQIIPQMIERGVISFKAFMAYAKRGMKLNDGELLRLMSVVARHGGLMAAHAENGDIIDFMEEKLISQGQQTPEFYPQSHPNLSEAEAVFRLLTLAQTTACPIYVPHISAAETLEVLALFEKWKGAKFYVETCPHYLTLTEEVMAQRGTIAKMAPPLRRQSDIDALWQAVSEGRIQVIGSDAAGSNIAANEPLRDKVFSAPNGVPGVETLLKVVYQAGVNDGRITMPQMVAQLSENPAKIFGLYPRKGSLQPGADADLVIVDPNFEYIIGETHPELKVDFSLYAGRQGQGTPILTMQRGAILYEDNKIKVLAGQGEYLPATRNTDVSQPNL